MGYVDEKLAEIGTKVEFESERTRLAFAAAMAETLKGLRIAGALSRPIAPNAVNYNAGGRLVGWSVRALGGDILLTLRDGHDVGGDVVATINLSTGQSSTVPLMPTGVSFVESLYVEFSGAGTPVGAVWIGKVG